MRLSLVLWCCKLWSAWKRQVRSSWVCVPVLVLYTCACTLMCFFSVWLCICVLCSCVVRVSLCSCVPVCASVDIVSRITVTDSMFYCVSAQQDGQFVRLHACMFVWLNFQWLCECGAICVYAPVHVWFCVLFGVVINLHVCSFCPFCFSACAIVTCVYVCLLPACLFMLVCPYACNYILFSSFSVRYLCAYWSLCINGLEYASLCASVVVRLYVCVTICLCFYLFA